MLKNKNSTIIYDNGLVLYNGEYEVTWNTPLAENANAIAERFAEIKTLLGEKNIELVLIPMPSRISLLSADILADTKDLNLLENREKANESYEEFIEYLNKNSLKYLDVLKIFRISQQNREGALLDDVHWNEDTSALVAKEAAHYIKMGSQKIFFSPTEEIRSWTMRPVSNYAFDQCKIRVSDVKYKDYKFYLADSKHYTSGFSYLENGREIWSLGGSSKLFFDGKAGKGSLSLHFNNPSVQQNI